MYCKCYLNLHPAFIVSKDYTAITPEDIMVKLCLLHNNSPRLPRGARCRSDTARIDELTGLRKMNEEGVYKAPSS
jgi:hypothetical protein